MGKLIDLTGQRFGRLTVLERAESSRNKQARWLCKCDCGKVTTAFALNLRRGHTQSCGCLAKEIEADMHTIHGGRHTRLYHIWMGMRARCYRETNHAYPRYGGRGITVCPEWLHDFAAFRDWALSHGYRDDLSIDRIDNDKGYSPDNCRWATAKEQRANQRPRRTLKTE